MLMSGFRFLGSKNDMYDTEGLLVGDLTCIDGKVYFWNGENLCELCDYETKDDYTTKEPFRETRCEHCGAPLVEHNGHIICEYCGTKYT